MTDLYSNRMILKRVPSLRPTPEFVATWLHLTALHESGHFLVALNLGMVLRGITLWAERRTSSDVWQFFGRCDWEQNYNALTPAVLRDRVAICTAGNAAESFWIPDFATVPNFWKDVRYVGDAQRAQENLSLLTPTPSTRHRENIVAEEWTRSRQIIEDRRECLVTLSNALLLAFHIARQRAKATDNIVRAELSAAQFVEIVQRVSDRVSGRTLSELVQGKKHHVISN